MRVVLAEDDRLLRAGLVELLRTQDIEVVGQAAEVPSLLRVVRETGPDVAVLDVRMPPSYTVEGLEAARQLRAEHGSALGLLVLSHHVESRYALDLLADGAHGVGYLLKDRVLDPRDLADSIRRVAAGGSAIDPEVVSILMRRRRDGPLASLTEREREVLALIAEGRSNRAVATSMGVAEKTVEAYTGRIFGKLGLAESPDSHRRVQAVLAWLHPEA